MTLAYSLDRKGDASAVLVVPARRILVATLAAMVVAFLSVTFTIAADDTVAIDPDATADGDESDGATLPIPREGRWRAVNGAGRIDCGSFSQPIPTARFESGRISVRRGGDRLILRGIGEGGSRPITADRDTRNPNRYVGKLRMRVEGIKADFTFTLNLRSDESIEGRMTATARLDGTRCTIRRPFELTYTGGS